MSNDTVVFEQQDDIAIIRLNRPEVHNALNDAAMSKLEEIQARIYGDNGVKVVILTGTGRESFCAGGDLKYFAAFSTREQALEMSRRMQKILDRFWSGDKVVIAAVNGRALGGGCEILTACHFRIAAEHAIFSFRQAANGVITGWGGGVRLFKLLGRSRALKLLLTSEDLAAADALRQGLVDRVVPNDQLPDSAMSLARIITANSAAAIGAFLEIARRIDTDGYNAAVQTETELFGDLWMGKDFRNWLNNFLNNDQK